MSRAHLPAAFADWRHDPTGCARRQGGTLARRINRPLERRHTLGFERGGRRYYLKYHWPLRWHSWPRAALAWVCGMLPVQSALAEVRALQAMRRRGLAAPRPVAWGRRRGHSFVVMEALQGCRSLELVVADWRANPPSAPHRRALLHALAAMVRRLHRAGIQHRDLYLCHFYLQLQSPPDAPHLHLIDLHRARMRPRLARRQLRKDLAALYYSALHLPLSRSDRLRFIRTYHARPLRQLRPRHWRLWQRTARRAHRLARRHRNPHRPAAASARAS